MHNARHRPPIYNPTLSNLLPLPDQWLDGNDTTTIDKAGPLPITNGATVLEWRTKSGTLRKYRLIGPNVAPTWEANVFGSLGAVRCVSNGSTGHILSADVLTGMRGLSGRTTVCAAKKGVHVPGATMNIFAVTVTHLTGSADGVQHSNQIVSFYTSGTRRIQSDAGALTIPFMADDVNGVPIAPGQVIVETCAVDFTSGNSYTYANGVLPKQFRSNPTTTGVTDAARDPYAMSVGAILQENGGLGANSANGWMDGWIFEILDWFTFLTPAQLVPVHDYMRRKYGAGAM